MLPVFWHVETGQWIDSAEITPLPPEGTEAVHDFRQIWNVNCFNCHATNLIQNFDTKTKTYGTTWTEMGIGCEACHGPGREHATAMRAWKAGETHKPATLKVISPRDGAAAADLRHMQVLPRKQDELLPRVSGRQSIRGLRAPVSDQPADSAGGSAGRLLARRTAQPLQSSAGHYRDRLL